MITFLRTEVFDAWLSTLKDKVGRARIIHRIRAAEHGNLGDCESVGEGVYEMRVHVGPGYRIYYRRRGEVVYLLLWWVAISLPRGGIFNAPLTWRVPWTKSKRWPN